MKVYLVICDWDNGECHEMNCHGRIIVSAHQFLPCAITKIIDFTLTDEWIADNNLIDLEDIDIYDLYINISGEGINIGKTYADDDSSWPYINLYIIEKELEL